MSNYAVVIRQRGKSSVSFAFFNRRDDVKLFCENTIRSGGIVKRVCYRMTPHSPLSLGKLSWFC